jgi:hypothetical protein
MPEPMERKGEQAPAEAAWPRGTDPGDDPREEEGYFQPESSAQRRPGADQERLEPEE